MVDFAAVNAAALRCLPALLGEWLPGGKVNGSEYIVRNPNRDDRSPGSFSVNYTTGRWGDFSTGDKGGDPVSLFAYIHNVGQADAARELEGRLCMSTVPAPAIPNKSQKTWTPIVPVPSDAPPPPAAHYRYGVPSMRWSYRDATGAVVGYVDRWNHGKKKEVRPLFYCSDGKGRSEWRHEGTLPEYPLYRLPELLARPTVPVMIVEGEKAADAAQRLLGDRYAVTCWWGGAQRVNRADLSPLAGRSVVLWPDADDPGRRAMESLARRLQACGAVVSWITPPPTATPGWDAADAKSEELTASEIEAMIGTSAPAATVEVKTPTAPPVTTGDSSAIRSRLWEITQDRKLSASERNRAISDEVVDWLHQSGRLFHTENQDFASVLFFDKSRKLLLPVCGDAFLGWLSDALAVNRADRVFSYVQAAIETEGLTDRSTLIDPARFWAQRDHRIYLSCGPGRVVRVGAGNVEMVDNGADDVLFPVGMALPEWHLVDPVDPFTTCGLFRDISTAAPHGRLLLQLWMVSLPTDQATKPPLCITGDVGSGKTKVSRGIFELYGLPPRIASVLKNGEGDFWAAVDAGGVTCFDNADTRTDWLADALAGAATAASLQKRRLYTDGDLVCLRSRAWVIITSASPSFAADAGLADRLLVVRLRRRTGGTAEAALSSEIMAARDAGLSWIAHTLSKALTDTGPVPSGLNARHPDFADFAVRIGRAMGQEAQVVAALRAAEMDKSLFNLENDPLGCVLLQVLADGFSGTAAELLPRMIVVDKGLEGRVSVRRMGKCLARLWPHLAALFQATRDTDLHTREVSYTFLPPVAQFAQFQTAFSEKSLRESNNRTLSKTPNETTQTTQGIAEGWEDS